MVYNAGGYPPARYTGGYETPYHPQPPPAPSASGMPPPTLPTGMPPPPGGFPPFPPGAFGGPAQTPSFHSPYDEYPSNAASRTPNFYDATPVARKYDQQQQDAYDPYAAGYDPGTPQMRTAPTNAPPFPPTRAPAPAPTSTLITLPGHASLPSRPVTSAVPPSDATELKLLTAPTTATIGEYTANIFSLPPQPLPITKYVVVNPDDAIDVHRAICQSGITKSVWYADGSNRAGEGWGAAIEWVLETGMSGAKLRTCVGNVDSLGTELGAIIKAVEGFRDHLQQSIRTQKPMSHEFVLFCSSAAAIVSLDTSSRPESIKFCQIWRDLCTDFLKAHMTLVWLPKACDVEGFNLAERIANVASSNSYQKRRKERTIPEMYMRLGGGEPAAGGSTEAGPWQRGDADPSRRKSPFERPVPLPMVLPESLPKAEPRSRSPSRSRSRSHSRSRSPRRGALMRDAVADEEEPIQPRAGALCVTNFPANANARDIGMLFAQFGEIVTVDLFSIPPVKSRFAFVAYDDPSVGVKAIEAFHRKRIDLTTPFARENADNLAIWKGWNGALAVVESEADRLVPLSLSQDIPELPDYAIADRRQPEANAEKKRNWQDDREPSPQKRARQDLTSDHVKSPSDAHSRTGFAGLPPRPSVSIPGDQAVAATSPSITNHNGGPHRSHPLHPSLPPTPLTASRGPDTSRTVTPVTATSKSPVGAAADARAAPLGGNSASMPQEFPIKLSGKTLVALINLVNSVFVKHDKSNWIAHTCLIATDIDQARRQLQDDLYATDEAIITNDDLERTLTTRGFTTARIDAFVSKVLKVLDGIAAEDEAEPGEIGAGETAETYDVPALEQDLERALQHYPEQTREAMTAAAKVLEYLHRGQEAQEKKRVDVERRVGVMNGMVKIGEQVSAVVRFLLTEEK